MPDRYRESGKMNLKSKDVLTLFIFNSVLLGITFLLGDPVNSYILLGVILGNLQFIILSYLNAVTDRYKEKNSEQ